MYDLIVIGSGPGGYAAAIRGAQLGMKSAVIESKHIGGICLNWGCIPTKALLRSAHLYKEMKQATAFGIDVTGEITPSFEKIIERSRNVANTMSKGVRFLLEKNKVEIIEGYGRLAAPHKVEVTAADGTKSIVEGKNIILATGARAKEFPHLKPNGKEIVTYKEAMSLPKQPESMVVVGSGAIGLELASFYHDLGTKVTIVEFMPNLLPNEDIEISKYLERSLRKARLPFMTSANVKKIDVADGKCSVTVESKKGEETIPADVVLVAVGVTPNTEEIGLETCGVATDRGKVVVDERYRTNAEGVFAIGDIINTPALAHVASAEAVNCVEGIAGLDPKPLDYGNVPACVYTAPEIASVGMKEAAAVEKGYEVRVGKFPYTASGKATAMGDNDGFIKLVFDAKTDKLLGAHFIGTNVTEMIMEAGIVKKLDGTAMDMIHTIHPHPTLSEAVMEAAAAAHNESVHL